MTPEARFEALYRQCADQVHAYATRRAAPATADDVVSETFLVAVRDAEAMADDVLTRVRDRQGREVVLLARIWTGKILRDHLEMTGHLDAVLETVRGPQLVA